MQALDGSDTGLQCEAGKRSGFAASALETVAALWNYKVRIQVTAESGFCSSLHRASISDRGPARMAPMHVNMDLRVHVRLSSMV